MITLSTHELTVTIDERLGGEITRLCLGSHELLASHTWEAPVRASNSQSYGDDTLDWLSEYRGGWQFLVPNAGSPCTVDDVPLPFHGEWSRTNVEIVKQSSSSITVRSGTRLPLVVERTITLLEDPLRVRIDTTIENVSASIVPFVWGEHPAFVTSPGDRIDLPAGRVVDASGSIASATTWPVSSTAAQPLNIIPDTSPSEMLHYLPERPGAWASLRRAEVGVGLAWDPTAFPHVWLWHQIGGQGLPWYGRTSLVAIEPASSWPAEGLAAAIERNQAHLVGPHERRTAWMVVVPFEPNGRPVRNVTESGTIEFETKEES